MTIVTNAVLGTVFFGVGLIATLLMYHLWRYPYDKIRRKSEAPRWLMNIHRTLGVAFVLLYVVLMSQMIPRIWHYEVAFRTQTRLHAALGIGIAVLLIGKLIILWFFRQLEDWTRLLGTLVFVAAATMLLISIPAVLEESSLADKAQQPENRSRVAGTLRRLQLPKAAKETLRKEAVALTSAGSMHQGHRLLIERCVQCHDLQTVTSKQRTPIFWYYTVQRMAAKPTIARPLKARQQRSLSAYLIGINRYLSDGR
jgi:hypothetical protein